MTACSQAFTVAISPSSCSFGAAVGRGRAPPASTSHTVSMTADRGSAATVAPLGTFSTSRVAAPPVSAWASAIATDS